MGIKEFCLPLRVSNISKANHANTRASWLRCSYGHHRCPRKSDKTERKPTAKLRHWKRVKPLETCHLVCEDLKKNTSLAGPIDPWLSRGNRKKNYKDVFESLSGKLKHKEETWLPPFSKEEKMCLPLKCSSMFVQYYKIMLKYSFIKFLICKKCAHIMGGGNYLHINFHL